MLRADTQTAYGLADQNPALDDVRARLEAINGRESYGFFFSPEVRVRLRAHIQGIARLPVPGADDWFVMSKHHVHDAAQAGLLFVRFPRSGSEGGAFGGSAPPGGPGVGELARFWGRGRSEHPGGLQQCGRVLALAQDPNRKGAPAFVSFVDARKPQSPSFMGQLTLAEPLIPKPFTGLSCAALTRLHDGHTLLIAYHYSASHPGSARAAVFRSCMNTLDASTTYALHAELTPGCGLPDGFVEANENIALLNQTDGSIFLACMRGKRSDNFVDLYRLTVDGTQLSPVSRKYLRTRVGRGTLRAGGALHITPQGELLLYAVQKNGGSAFRDMMIEEFAP